MIKLRSLRTFSLQETLVRELELGVLFGGVLQLQICVFGLARLFSLDLLGLAHHGAEVFVIIAVAFTVVLFVVVVIAALVSVVGSLTLFYGLIIRIKFDFFGSDRIAKGTLTFSHLALSSLNALFLLRGSSSSSSSSSKRLFRDLKREIS